ncbi:pre-peptidase C-terminal domain-containing protein [Crenothrix polyspora]|nr:pre-peptidase C-terminal domain-containing protein [Crenothrix polyspora]
MKNAYNLDSAFNKNADNTIGKPNNGKDTNISESFFHSSVIAITEKDNSSLDWYSFNVTASNKNPIQAYFDIDQTSSSLDSFIKLYNSFEKEIDSNNDHEATDPGSLYTGTFKAHNGKDSFISYTFKATGLYYLSIGNAVNPPNDKRNIFYQNPLSTGQNYTLHVSLSDNIAVNNQQSNVPTPPATLLFGSGLIGFMGMYRQKIFATTLTA